MIKPRIAIVLAVAALLTGGCATGRTGKIGTPIAQRYTRQLAQLKIGVSSPADLQRIFGAEKVGLQSTEEQNGKLVQVWELARGGNMDAGELLLWGRVSYDKDQAMLFRFEGGRLASWKSVVFPDPPEPARK